MLGANPDTTNHICPGPYRHKANYEATDTMDLAFGLEDALLKKIELHT